MASANSRKADRLAYKKGQVAHVTQSGEVITDRQARRLGLKRRDFSYSTDDGETEE